MATRNLSFMNYSDYKVSTRGNVYTKRKRGAKFRLNPEPEREEVWRRLKPGARSGSGHLHVTLRRDDGKAKIFYVHTLVLLAFVGKPKRGQECCHFPDRNPANNHIDNLSWGSKKRNQRHRLKHGTDCRGEKHKGAKLTWKKVRKIRKLYRTTDADGKKWTEPRMMRRFGIARTTLQNVLYHKTWIDKT